MNRIVVNGWPGTRVIRSSVASCRLRKTKIQQAVRPKKITSTDDVVKNAIVSSEQSNHDCWLTP